MIAVLTSWLQDFFIRLLEFLYNIFIDFVQVVIDGFCTAALLVVGLFPEGTPVPTSGTAPVSETASQVFTCIAWVFPVSYLLSLVVFCVVAVTAYFVIAPLARWFKLLT